ncbi:uncharacterized protein LOC143738892 [Siphateles boraxobius]|uniref:uncharacterized protein LOC143738892 n=1 Tax=Siphateles boraxobius TaxID=180520 RepID=UPI004063FFB6
MSFQIYFKDMRHRCERITVSNSEEEFRNTTVEDLKRNLIPEDQLEDTILRYRFKTLEKNRTLGFYSIKHEDHITAVHCGISGSGKPQNSSFYRPPVHVSGVKHEDEITSECKHGGHMHHTVNKTCFTGFAPSSTSDSIEWLVSEGSPEDDEDKVIPRSRSMDNVCDMNQPQLKPSE